ncbi:YceI family protein [Parvularcula sp. IMCC14364]|uniref:YceI family protein n=1 Tax=Parvularcula sp. IMCC14364 TaxID=3067902 RepID=UPI0027424159|nr:YceI family protein [Parvularcula sp. IMCC14364]
MRFATFLVLPIILTACGGAGDSAVANSVASAGAAEAGAFSELVSLDGDFVWTPDYAASAVTFSAEQEGSIFEGRFDSFRAAIRLNPDNLGDAEIHAIIDMASVDAGDDDRNSSLPTNDWFRTRSFPTATFRSSAVSERPDGTYEAAGELTIKGVSRPVTLPFELEIDGNMASASGSISLDRTDFNVGEGAYADDAWIGYTVDVSVTVTASRQD